MQAVPGGLRNPLRVATAGKRCGPRPKSHVGSHHACFSLGFRQFAQFAGLTEKRDFAKAVPVSEQT